MRDLRTVWLIARREIRTRVLQRTFVVSTLVVLFVLGAAVTLPVLVGGVDEYTVAAVDESGRRVVSAAAGAADPDDLLIETADVDGESAARSLVEDGEADAALLPGPDGLVLLADERPPTGLERALQTASAQLRSAAAVAEAGLDPQQARTILSPTPLPVESLSQVDESDLDAGLVAFAGSVLLYGQLLAYCVWVASGVVEEKSSRVVEVLLATIRPRQLLAGKILGIGLVGMFQLLLIAGVGVGVATAVGSFELPPSTAQVALGVLLWFVLGFAFYSCAYAVAGSLVSRVEDVQNTSAPLTVLILGSFFASFPIAQAPDTTFATVMSLLPPVAPLVMPGRMAAGAVGAAELTASVAAIVVASALLVVVASRLYEGSVLRTGGRISIREAWRSRSA